MSKQFAEFKINETFSLESTSSGIDGDKINPKEGTTPYITRGINENGIRQYVTDAQPGSWKKDKGNVITIGLDTQTAYYQPVPFITGQNIHVLSHESMSQRVAMYIVPQLKKLMLKYSWGGNGATLGRLSQDTLVLPVTDTTVNTPNPEPDWEYMENYIKAIERKYIDQIAEHNTREQEILEQLHPESIETKPEAHGFEAIRVRDVFEVTGSRSTDAGTLTLSNNEGAFQFVGRTAINNGIQGFCEYLGFQPNLGSEISISQVGTIDAQWREKPYYTSQNIVRCKNKGEPFNSRKGLYVVTLLKSHLSRFIGYTTPKIEDIEEFQLLLPITPTGDIDWDYMEHYIAWIETQERESRKLCASREEQILEQLHRHY